MTRLVRFLGSPAAILVVLALALALRAGGLGRWSLWEDEETALHFSQHPEKPFPRHFPIFFVTLQHWLRLTGVSVVAGRALAAIFGLIGVSLTYVCFRRLLSHPVALLASLFVALGLGHLFWSQSIRYYTLVLDFQILCMYWFLDGLERGNRQRLLLANLALFLALYTHFTAILLAPVLVAHLALVIWRREDGPGYSWKHYRTFGIPFALIMFWFAWRFLEFQRLRLAAADMLGAAPQGPLDILLRIAVYFGAPLLLFALLAPLVAKDVPRRVLWFLMLAGFLPMLELIVIAQLHLAVIAWYYILFAMPALALLTAAFLVSLYQRGWRASAVGLGVATVLSFAPFLVGYYTTMYGDRPRWEEAAGYLRESRGIKVGASDNPEVYATVPGVVAFYLGVDAAETMGNPLVRNLPLEPPAGQAEQWFVVEVSVISREYLSWLDQHCEVRARFEARSGPKDRTLVIYVCPGNRGSP